VFLIEINKENNSFEQNANLDYKYTELSEVIIHNEKSIAHKKDTIVFNAK
jgi:hypothetical protein